MDKNNIKLTVAIPTFNGERHIREAIDSIAGQTDSVCQNCLELLISDNCSTDQTAEIIAEYRKKFPFITYFRNDENKGPDANFDLAVRRSSGRFVWLLSDGDILAQGAVAKVLIAISKYPDVALMCANYSLCYPDFSGYFKEKMLEIGEDIYTHGGDEFFLKSKFLNGLVSSIIVRRDMWEKANVKKYIGTNWVQFGALFELMSGQNGYIFSDALIKERCGEPTWPKGEFSLRVGLNLVDIFNSIVSMGYKTQTAAMGVRMMKGGLWKAIILTKKDSAEISRELVGRMIKTYGKYISFWLCDFPLILMPGWVHKAVYLFYKKFFAKDCQCH